MTCLEAALSYAQRDWPVLAVHTPTKDGCSCGKDCGNIGKHPRWHKDDLEHGLKDATTDPKTIKVWWERWPNANIGIATGKDSFDVLDVDVKDGINGTETLENFERIHGKLPDTPEQITGGGGRQLLFMASGTLKNAVRFAQGLDIRTDGGYICAPPSLHVSGRHYEWELSSVPGEIPLAAWPSWLLKIIQDKSGGNGNGNPKGWEEPFLKGVEQGQRDATAARLAGKYISQGLKPAEVCLLLNGWDRQNNPPLGENIIHRVVESIARIHNQRQSRNNQSFNLTDLGNSERLISQHGQDLRYCHPWHKWLVWDGTRWKLDDTAAVRRMARGMVRHIYKEASEASSEADAKVLAKHAIRSEADAKIKAALSLAESEEGIPVLPDDLDTNHWLLNCQNGTLDLKTGKLLPHNRDDLITKIAPVNYDPQASCPTWDAFLYRVMDQRQNLIDFLQKTIGYSLTGSIREQCMFILWGAGANGKSTFIQAVNAGLGDYAEQTPTQTFLLKGNNAIPNDVAALRGARFVSAVESEGGRRMAESLIKQLTGGDTVTARFMRAEFFSYVPTFKVWLGTNHKPEIKGTDHAIWRRIRLIPFNVTIPEPEQDPELLDKLKAELPGILAWAVKGCLLWQKERLGIPKEVQDATSEYRAEMDVLGTFLADRCLITTEYPISVTKKELYIAYETWCQINQEEALPKRKFGRIIKERGITDKRVGNERKWYWTGIGILENGDFSSWENESKVSQEASEDSLGFYPENGQNADIHFSENGPKVEKKCSNEADCNSSYVRESPHEKVMSAPIGNESTTLQNADIRGHQNGVNPRKNSPSRNNLKTRSAMSAMSAKCLKITVCPISKLEPFEGTCNVHTADNRPECVDCTLCRADRRL